MLEEMVHREDTVEMVMGEIQIREVTSQVVAVVVTGKVARTPMAVEVTVGAEVVNHLTKFGRQFQVKMLCDVFCRCWKLSLLRKGGAKVSYGEHWFTSKISGFFREVWTPHYGILNTQVKRVSWLIVCSRPMGLSKYKQQLMQH
jgi:hypothetical protein